MRKVVLAFSLVFLSGSLSGACNPPSGKLVLLVAGISGPSGACPNGIDLSSARITVSGPKGSAATAVISKPIDSSSPGLLGFMANGKHLSTVMLIVPAADGKSSTYELKDVLISSFRQNASPAVETLTLNFASLEGHQYQAASEGRGPSYVEVKGPGPYSFQGTSQPASVQLSMKLDNEDTKISGVTLTGSSRNGKVEMQMAVATPGRELGAEAARERQYTGATVTLNRGSSAFASYVLHDVKVSSAGNQTSIAFAKIEFKYGSGAPTSSPNAPGRFGWNLKENKKV